MALRNPERNIIQAILSSLSDEELTQVGKMLYYERERTSGEVPRFTDDIAGLASHLKIQVVLTPDIKNEVTIFHFGVANKGGMTIDFLTDQSKM